MSVVAPPVQSLPAFPLYEVIGDKIGVYLAIAVAGAR
jgi:hypothetical protein